MIKKLGLQQSLVSENRNVMTFNVGGQKITNQLTTLNKILSPIKMIHPNDENDIFIDYDPKLFQHLINQFRKNSSKEINSFGSSSSPERRPFTTTTAFSYFSARRKYYSS
jgi:hypothetical protein